MVPGVSAGSGSSLCEALRLSSPQPSADNKSACIGSPWPVVLARSPPSDFPGGETAQELPETRVDMRRTSHNDRKQPKMGLKHPQTSPQLALRLPWMRPAQRSCSARSTPGCSPGGARLWTGASRRCRTAPRGQARCGEMVCLPLYSVFPCRTHIGFDGDYSLLTSFAFFLRVVNVRCW